MRLVEVKKNGGCDSGVNALLLQSVRLWVHCVLTRLIRSDLLIHSTASCISTVHELWPLSSVEGEAKPVSFRAGSLAGNQGCTDVSDSNHQNVLTENILIIKE